MNKKQESLNQRIISNDHSLLMEKVLRKFGEGKVSTLEKTYENVEFDSQFIDTGSLILNRAIGTNGFPFGKVVEIFGEESSGKTTIALHSVRECQKAGKIAAYIDLENALNVNFAKEIGVDCSKLLLITPDNGDQAFEIIKELINENAGLIVVDSVATLIPKEELEGDYNTQSLGLHARLMSKGLRIINDALKNKETVVVFINQLRQKIQTFPTFGNPETTTGGKALRFLASIRIKLKRESRKIEDRDGKYIGITTRAEVIKNRLAAPYGIGHIEIIFEGGIKKEREVIDLGVQEGIIVRSGAWFSFGDEKLSSGKENSANLLSKRSDLFQKIKDSLLKRWKDLKA